jgi:hypothetical protein
MNLRLQADLWLAYLVGSIEALVLVRLVLQLFAARPDNLMVSIILSITNPLITPLSILDTGQPHVGAILEFSTLAVCLLIPILWIIVVRLRRSQPTPSQ